MDTDTATASLWIQITVFIWLFPDSSSVIEHITVLQVGDTDADSEAQPIDFHVNCTALSVSFSSRETQARPTSL